MANLTLGKTIFLRMIYGIWIKVKIIDVENDTFKVHIVLQVCKNNIFKYLSFTLPHRFDYTRF